MAEGGAVAGKSRPERCRLSMETAAEAMVEKDQDEAGDFEGKTVNRHRKTYDCETVEGVQVCLACPSSPRLQGEVVLMRTIACGQTRILPGIDKPSPSLSGAPGMFERLARCMPLLDMAQVWVQGH